MVVWLHGSLVAWSVDWQLVCMIACWVGLLAKPYNLTTEMKWDWKIKNIYLTDVLSPNIQDNPETSIVLISILVNSPNLNSNS